MSKISVAELLKKYTSGEKNFEKVELQGANLKGADLRGINLIYANLNEADLTGCDLRDSRLDGADLNGANLSEARLDRASLTRASLNRANLNKASLNETKLIGAFLQKASLIEANLGKAYLTIAYLNGANLSKANLSEAYLNGCRLNETNLTGVKLNGANLDKADLNGACYSDNTSFEPHFDPISVGMKKISEEGEVTVEKLLNIFNSLSQFSNHYLGGTMTVKYFESSRPDFDWLNYFKIDRSGRITFSGVLTEAIDSTQLQWSQKWIDAYVKSCSQIIQDFPNLIQKNQIVSSIAPPDSAN